MRTLESELICHLCVVSVIVECLHVDRKSLYSHCEYCALCAVREAFLCRSMAWSRRLGESDSEGVCERPCGRTTGLSVEGSVKVYGREGQREIFGALCVGVPDCPCGRATSQVSV